MAHRWRWRRYKDKRIPITDEEVRYNIGLPSEDNIEYLSIPKCNGNYKSRPSAILKKRIKERELQELEENRFKYIIDSGFSK